MFLSNSSNASDSGGGDGQGGYSCSIRAVTEWESYRTGYVHEHPNFYSQYMDGRVEGDGHGVQYSWWQDMGWEPTHFKTDPLQLSNDDLNISTVATTMATVFVYTDKGYLRDGVWKRTEAPWTKGACIIEFQRVCDDPNKIKEVWSISIDSLVQDTDLAFRPRIEYDDKRAYPVGTWSSKGGQCVDHVHRGCFNNGTCIGPNECRCGAGWLDSSVIESVYRLFTGAGLSSNLLGEERHFTTLHELKEVVGGILESDSSISQIRQAIQLVETRGDDALKAKDCSVPVCDRKCLHNGNCTSPNTCTCERGWTGIDCSVPVCAQQCSNGGLCIAPDTCFCPQWENGFRDGRGVPLYQRDDGSPQLTGWTGYDCSSAICVQAERFRYNKMVTSNDGRSFQTGCGYDPIDTGCCYELDYTPDSPFSYNCFRCKDGFLEVTAHNVTCRDMNLNSFKYALTRDVPLSFRDNSDKPRLCGKAHSPAGGRGDGLDDGFAYDVSNMPIANPHLSSSQNQSQATSDRFLCNVLEWEQGDYIDDAGYSDGSTSTSSSTKNGANDGFQLEVGRHIRINHNSYIQDPNDPYRWTKGEAMQAEGTFECFNGGYCVGPDVCKCRDGWGGYDCREPLCRHTLRNGSIVEGCQNGGICVLQDTCQCIQTTSILWQIHDNAERGVTGYTGSDCSLPICTNPGAYFDPFCSGEHAPSGEGCFRCANGGYCLEPDLCACADGWAGYDCQTPICEAEVTPLIRNQLMTVDTVKLKAFELDPCGEGNNQGTCARPNQCICHCEAGYNPQLCKSIGGYCTKPFQDPLYRLRDVLARNEVFGTRSCSSGYEGYVDERTDAFRSCHLVIYEPSFFVRNTVLLLFLAIIVVLSLCCVLGRRTRRRLGSRSERGVYQ